MTVLGQGEWLNKKWKLLQIQNFTFKCDCMLFSVLLFLQSLMRKRLLGFCLGHFQCRSSFILEKKTVAVTQKSVGLDKYVLGQKSVAVGAAASFSQDV